jgi:uncharacterized protein
MKRIFALVAAAWGSLAVPVAAQSPSFDCGKARHPDELAICSMPALAQLDTIVAAGYAFLKAQHGRPFADQIGIPTWRMRQACQSDTDCIFARQVEAINAYRAAGAPVGVPSWALAAHSEAQPPSSPIQAVPSLVPDEEPTT